MFSNLTSGLTSGVSSLYEGVKDKTNAVSSTLYEGAKGVKEKVRGPGPDSPEPIPPVPAPAATTAPTGDDDSEKTEGPDSDASPGTEAPALPSDSKPPRPPLPSQKSLDAAKFQAAMEGGQDATGAGLVGGVGDAAKQVGDASAKAMNTAKEWGGYFATSIFSYGKAAGEKVAETAVKVKTTVEEKTILGEFGKEQEKFMNEKREQSKQEEAAVPPWVGYNEEEAIKTQILALSSDQRNFLRNPPSGMQFNFDYTSAYPVAMVMLQEDKRLEKMRFELVPKQLTEETFWRNYFYRVSLIKQSATLTTLAQQTETKPTRPSNSPEKTTDKEQKTSDPIKMVSGGIKEDDMTASSPRDDEFISDAYNQDSLNQEELRQGMQQLGMRDGKTDENIPEWERELQAELDQEYEMVEDDENDADLEKEIMQEIEAEGDLK